MDTLKKFFPAVIQVHRYNCKSCYRYTALCCRYDNRRGCCGSCTVDSLVYTCARMASGRCRLMRKSVLCCGNSYPGARICKGTQGLSICNT